mmetsp:Transcript_59745/g.71793  ORF Transcript_59745/g.71793 Transcript_59745/m.71793 type:complete len:105 (+) Transcript_59745:65-379(+)
MQQYSSRSFKTTSAPLLHIDNIVQATSAILLTTPKLVNGNSFIYIIYHDSSYELFFIIDVHPLLGKDVSRKEVFICTLEIKQSVNDVFYLEPVYDPGTRTESIP